MINGFRSEAANKVSNALKTRKFKDEVMYELKYKFYDKLFAIIR